MPYPPPRQAKGRGPVGPRGRGSTRGQPWQGSFPGGHCEEPMLAVRVGPGLPCGSRRGNLATTPHANQGLVPFFLWDVGQPHLTRSLVLACGAVKVLHASEPSAGVEGPSQIIELGRDHHPPPCTLQPGLQEEAGITDPCQYLSSPCPAAATEGLLRRDWQSSLTSPLCARRQQPLHCCCPDQDGTEYNNNGGGMGTAQLQDLWAQELPGPSFGTLTGLSCWEGELGANPAPSALVGLGSHGLQAAWPRGSRRPAGGGLWFPSPVLQASSLLQADVGAF